MGYGSLKQMLCLICLTHFQTQMSALTVCAHLEKLPLQTHACTEPQSKLCYPKAGMTVLKTFGPAAWVAVSTAEQSETVSTIMCFYNLNQCKLELGEGICSSRQRKARRPFLYTQARWINPLPNKAHGLARYLAVHISENTAQ